MNPFSLEGQTALITGGGTGLGFGIATSFVQAGAKVVIVGRREEELSKAVAALGDSASYQVHDITQLDQAQSLIDRVTDSHGGINILVNNAGIHIKKKAVETTDEDFQRMMQTHVFGAYALTRAVIPQMATRGSGSLLFMASMTSYIGMPLVVTYAAAKSAYLGIVHTLSTELAPQGIRVNGIAPGWIDSDITRVALGKDPERKQKVMMRIAMGKMGEASDIGNAAVYLSSPAAKYVSGVILPVDGGALNGF